VVAVCMQGKGAAVRMLSWERWPKLASPAHPTPPQIALPCQKQTRTTTRRTSDHTSHTEMFDLIPLEQCAAAGRQVYAMSSS